MKEQLINITFIIKGNSISDIESKILLNSLYKLIKFRTKERNIELEKYDCTIQNVDE